ncbi:MAG: glycosyl transferase [Leptospira sp.]|nr:glycosyl transferase [Leptospira sp.]
MKILYYVSSHGYGHISRSYEIIRKLISSSAIHSVTIASQRIDFIKEKSEKIYFRNIAIDVGVHQKDSLSLDVDLTLNKLEEFEKNKNALLEAEAKFAVQEDFDLIISDSASLPFVIGVEAKIPTIFIGNFTWDFIYSNFAKYNPNYSVISNIIKVEYSFATSAFLLPFTCPIDGFLEIEKVGLVGRKSLLSKKEARTKFKFKTDIKYFLFSFGAYGLKDIVWNWDCIPDDWVIVCSELAGFESEQILNIPHTYYPDLVKAVDFVVTKPGYGIISEAIFAETPIIYTDRGDFAEYPHLVKALEKSHLCSYISQTDLLRFDFKESIEKIQNTDHNKITKLSLEGEKDILDLILRTI